MSRKKKNRNNGIIVAEKTPQDIDSMPKATIDFPQKGTAGMILPDGKIYYTPSTYGASVLVPMGDKIICAAVSGKDIAEKIDPQVLRMPSEEWKLPWIYVKRWGEILMSKFDGESLLIYGRKVDDPTKWLAVVPEQEVAGASVDVDDFSKAWTTLVGEGYEKVGTIHTHPGGMTQCSSTDRVELWTDFGGIHMIIARTGAVSYWYSIAGVSWRLMSDTWKLDDIWKTAPTEIPADESANGTIYSEDGKVGFTAGLVTPKVYTAYNNMGGWNQGTGGYRGLNNYNDSKDVYKGTEIEGKTMYFEQDAGVIVDWEYTKFYAAYSQVGTSWWIAGIDPTKLAKYGGLHGTHSLRDRMILLMNGAKTESLIRCKVIQNIRRAYLRLEMAMKEIEEAYKIIALDDKYGPIEEEAEDVIIAMATLEKQVRGINAEDILHIEGKE